MKSLAAVVTAIILALGSPLAAEQSATEPSGHSFAANDTDFLNLMGNHEGYRGFGTISDYAPMIPDYELTTMTVGEVLSYQELIRQMGTRSSAVGRYQFIYDTLSGLVERHNISRDLIFDEEVQTWLARQLMFDCGFYDTSSELIALGNCLAGQWAALPMLSGAKAGKSQYHGDGLNRASVPANVLYAVLESRFIW